MSPPRRPPRGEAERWGEPQAVAVQAALADQQAGRPGVLDGPGGGIGVGRAAVGSTSSMPIMSPLPRTSPTTPNLSATGASCSIRRRPTVSTLPWRSWAEGVAQVRERAGRRRAGCRRTSRSSWRCIASIRSARRDDPGDGQPVADALGEGDHVGHDVVRLIAPEVLAGATPPRLHLVGDEEDPVLVEHVLHRPEEPVGRHGEPADALDRLGDHAGDVAGGGRGDDVAQVVRRTPRCTPASSRSRNGLRKRYAAVHVADV